MKDNLKAALKGKYIPHFSSIHLSNAQLPTAHQPENQRHLVSVERSPFIATYTREHKKKKEKKKTVPIIITNKCFHPGP